MKKLLMLTVMALFAVVLTACGTDKSEEKPGSGTNDKSEEITVKHELGETKVKKNPKKVVVFDFGSLDTLDKLGVDIAALPKANIPKYLSKYEDDKYKNVGSLKEPDFEKIHAEKPDLIIISGRQMDLYEEFKEIAPTIYLGIDPSDYMKSFEKNAKTLGEIFGKEDEVKQELASIQEQISKLNEKAKATKAKALVILANEGKASAYGPSSRFGLIHDVFGFEAVDPNIEISTHGQPISFEYIQEKNPDYLFVVDRTAVVEGESSKQAIENDLVKKTNAYKNKKIVYLQPDAWYLSGGGLESVAAMVKEVEESLN